MSKALLVIADEELREAVYLILKRQTELTVEHAGCEADARSFLGRSSNYALVVVHINIPANDNSSPTEELSGLPLVTWLGESKPNLPVILIYPLPEPVLNKLFDRSRKVRLVRDGVDLPQSLLAAVNDSLADTLHQRERYLTLSFTVYEAKKEWVWALNGEGEDYSYKANGLLEVGIAKLKKLSSKSQNVYDLMSRDDLAWPNALKDLGADIFKEILQGNSTFWGEFNRGFATIEGDYDKLKICFHTNNKIYDIALESLCSDEVVDKFWMLHAPIYRWIGGVGVATRRKPLFSCRESYTSEEINCLIIEADAWGKATLPHGTIVDLPKLDWKRSSTLSVGDLVDLPSFAMKLKRPVDPVSTYLKDRLSDGTLTALANYNGLDSDPIPLKLTLVKSLNKLIGSQSIYDAERFAGVSLRQETQKLLAQNPEGDSRLRLNRLLLEDAYEREISKNDWSKTEGESECEKIQNKLMENKKKFGIGRVVVVSKRDLGDETFWNYLSKTLTQGPWDLIHYAGHSYFHPFEKRGYLFFPNRIDGNAPFPIPIEDFGALLGQARFVYLSSCQSAQGNFLASLAQCKVPALLGFSCPVYDEHAEEFALEFYEQLFGCEKSVSATRNEGDQKCLQHAFLRARKQLHGEKPTETIWAQPILMFQSE